jgi:hypothetical protein
MRVTTTYNGADEVAEKKKRSLIFCVPISIYNLLILDSWSSLFHNYRICLWAFLAHGLPPGQAGFMQKPAQAHTHGPLALPLISLSRPAISSAEAPAQLRISWGTSYH